MLFARLQGPRSKINRNGNFLELIIPSRKNYFVIAFLPIWLAGWVFGEFAVFRGLLGHTSNAPAPFLILWFVCWTAGGLFGITLFAWNVGGKEVAIVNSSALILEKKIGSLKYSKQFAMNEINDVRLVNLDSSYFLRYHEDLIPNFKYGTIAFDYGMKTFRFAAGIDEAEAKHVLERLRQEGYFRAQS